jgi:hypothetical protein
MYSNNCLHKVSVQWDERCGWVEVMMGECVQTVNKTLINRFFILKLHTSNLITRIDLNDAHILINFLGETEKSGGFGERECVQAAGCSHSYFKSSLSMTFLAIDL